MSQAPHRNRNTTRYFLEKLALYVLALAEATIVRFCCAPSVHDRKKYLPRSVWGEGALTALLDPTITVREKGAVLLTHPNVSINPVGFV